MGYNSYEEYMNNLLGRTNTIEKEVPVENNIVINTEIGKIEENNSNNDVDTYNLENNTFEAFYPDIYKIVYPVVCKRCLEVDEELTEDLIEKITNEIYEVVEKDEVKEVKKDVPIYNSYNSFRNSRNYKNTPRVEENTIQRETRQRNFLLNDLIKILVLRELIGNGRRPPVSRPPRPPMLPNRPEDNPLPPPRPEGRPPRF